MIATVALLVLLNQSPLNVKAQPFDIPAAAAKDALWDFFHNIHNDVPVTFLFMPEDFEGISTRAVKGIMTPCEALRQLIAGTPIIVWDSGQDLEVACTYSPLRLRY